MDAADPFARCAVLRVELADLLDTLDDTQLATRSLCGDWFLPKRRLAGLRLVPSDVDETWGEGTEVTGRAADLALALVGRRAGLDRITGPGRDVLAGRL